MFACKVWGLRATELHQGVVYGVETDETKLDERLATRLDYDGIWGTVLNRFCVEAAIGHPLIVYGKGRQSRVFLVIRDTMRCVELTILKPAQPGEYLVYNQFTEQFEVRQLAEMVKRAAARRGTEVQISHLDDPRFEAESHYFHARHEKLLDLGLKPHYLSDGALDSILDVVWRYRDRVREHTLLPFVNWRRTQNPSSYETKKVEKGDHGESVLDTAFPPSSSFPKAR